MRASKPAVILLIVTLAGIAMAAQNQQVPSAQTDQRAVSGGQPRTDQEIVNLRGHKSELTRGAQVLELDLAGIDARRKALQEQIALIRDDAGKRSAAGGQLAEFSRELSRLAMDKAGKEAQQQTVRRQLEDVQRQLAQVAPSSPRTDADAVNLGGHKSELTRRAQAVELDLAGIGARRKALQEQIALVREDVGKQSAGGGQLEEFSRELSRLAIDKAGKEAQQQTVRRQLEDVQKQLARVAPLIPRTDADAVNLGGQKSELTRRAQILELDLAGIDARRKALQEQIALVREDAGKRSAGGGRLEEFAKEQSRLVVDKAGKEAQLQTVRRQVQDVQKQLAEAAPSAPRTDQEAVNLGGQKNELTRRAQAVELDLAAIDARQKTLREQIAAIRGEASKGLATGGQLEEFTRELSRLAIDKAGKEAQQQTISRQLEEVQEQLAQVLLSER